MTRHWLAKSEPETYSIDDLKRDCTTLWDGVRNYQARNMLRDEWNEGDLVIFYHSNSEPPGAAGICKVSKERVVDPTQFDKRSDYFDPRSDKKNPRWFAPEVKFVKKFQEIVPLQQIRKEKSLSGMQLLKRGNRLSVMPLTKAEYNKLLALAENR